MRIVVAVEARLTQVGNDVLSPNLTYERFWKRYTSQFDEVLVFARISPGTERPAGWQPANGPRLRFLHVPFYHGPLQYLTVRGQVRKAARAAAEQADAAILRVPGVLSTAIWHAMHRLGKPHAVEVVGDPWEVFARGGARTRLRFILRRTMRRDLERQCASAAAALYVTRDALQRRYPSRGPQVSCSDVALDPDDYATPEQLNQRQMRAQATGPARECLCVHIGSMDQPYKRQDLLIRAIAECRRRGIGLRLKLLGDGKYRPEFEQVARDAGVGKDVEFTGFLPAGQPIRDALDEADFFALPSATEGLPRALLEAMARGLPCLATDVGGIPELLDPSYLLPLDIMPAQFADRIAWVLDQGTQPAIMSNARRATEYSGSILQSRHVHFLNLVRQAAAQQSAVPAT